jgi:hypothetical protein
MSVKTYAHEAKRAEHLARKTASVAIANRVRDEKIRRIKEARELQRVRFNADFDPDRFVDPDDC